MAPDIASKGGVWAGLTPRQRLTLCAHLFKAVTRQHHREMAPLLRQWIPSDGVVIDVGAHAGQYTKLFAALAPRGHIHAVEPGGYARLILTTTVRLRGLTNVTVHPIGLSDRAGEAELAVPVKASGSVGFGLSHLGDDVDGRAVRRETIRLDTLDRLVRELGLDRLDFIKADVEGWEAPLMRGGRECLTRHRPAVMLEIVEAHLTRANATPRELWNFLEQRGYEGRRVAPGGVLDGDTGDRGDGDYLFTPGARR